MLLKVCCFLQVICSRNAGILVLILEFKFITWSCLFPLWGQEWSPWFRMVWVFVRQLLVTFWAWAACLGQLGLSQIHLHIRNPKGIRCQNLLREHLCHLSHPRWHRSAVLMGTGELIVLLKTQDLHWLQAWLDSELKQCHQDSISLHLEVLPLR